MNKSEKREFLRKVHIGDYISLEQNVGFVGLSIIKKSGYITSLDAIALGLRNEDPFIEVHSIQQIDRIPYQQIVTYNITNKSSNSNLEKKIK